MSRSCSNSSPQLSCLISANAVLPTAFDSLAGSLCNFCSQPDFVIIIAFFAKGGDGGRCYGGSWHCIMRLLAPKIVARPGSAEPLHRYALTLLRLCSLCRPRKIHPEGPKTRPKLKVTVVSLSSIDDGDGGAALNDLQGDSDL